MLAHVLAVLVAAQTPGLVEPVPVVEGEVPTGAPVREGPDRDHPHDIAHEQSESTAERLTGQTNVQGPIDVNKQQLPNAPVERLSWKTGATRKFIATQTDLGYIYLRPRVILGYGAPFFKWVGVEANPLLSQNYLGAWGGVRLTLPVIDLRIGARYIYSLRRDYLPDLNSFDRTAIELTRNGGNARTITYEAELSTGFATKLGELSALGSISRIGNVPDGMYVYEESLHVVAEPTFIWRARGAFGFYAVPRYRQFTIGPALDFIAVPERRELLIRAGAVVRVVLNRQIEIRGTFVPTVNSRDDLGLLNSDFTELGLRYRWASD